MKKFMMFKNSFQKEGLNKLRNKKHGITEKEIIKNFSSSTRQLKLIDGLEAALQNELIMFGETSEPVFLWQEKLIYQFNFFVTMIGVLDGKIDYIGKQIKYNENVKAFLTSDEILKITNQKQELFLLRKEVVDNLFSMCTGTQFDHFLEDVVKTCPSRSKFNEIYNNLDDPFDSDNNNFSLQLKFIDAYNRGYESSIFYDLRRLVNEYRYLYSDLKSCIQKNEAAKMKVKKSFDTKK